MSSCSERRKCTDNPDIFCYICGCFVLASEKRNIIPFVQKAYLGYYQVKLGDHDKSWAPHKACKTCVETLPPWTQEKKFIYNLEYQ